MTAPRSTVYCCIPIEFIQPWDQNEAIRQVQELALGNMVMLQGTFHVGNREEDRQFWQQQFPSLTAKIDATPQFPERPDHGMAVVFDLPLAFRCEQLRLCRALGLQVFSFFPALLHLPESECAQMLQAGSGVVLAELVMAENTSLLGVTLSPERLRQIDTAPVASHAEGYRTDAVQKPSIFAAPEALDFRALHDWFVARFAAAGREMRARGAETLAAVEASAQMRLAMEAGVDVPVLELVPHEPLRGLAAVRGAAKAYGKPVWGVHTAMGYYRAPTDAWTPARLRIAYDLFFAGGARLFTECNMPLRNWGSCSAFFSIRATPPIRAGEVECRTFDDPICRRARDLLADFYRFVQFHQRPAHGPRVRLGYVLGYLDGWTGTGGERMWMLDHPGFLAPDALKSWRHFDRVFDSESWYVAPRKYYWQADPAKPLREGTPPCGQVDIVPIEAQPNVLNSYRCLVLLGWNTMTEDHYARLQAYVAQGGTLFVSVPHLDTRTRADQPSAFIHGGDVRDLCGVRIVGAGETAEEVLFAAQTDCPRYRFPQGTLYLEPAPLAALELHGARPLAYPREKPHEPVLLEHHVGKGIVYLLATWEYPGERLDAFITDILRTLAEGEQAEIAVEGRDVFYAVYDGSMPSGLPFATVYLVNHDIYGQPAYPRLRWCGQRVFIRVAHELRIAWLCDRLLAAPHDRFVNVSDIRRDADAWLLTLDAIPATGAGERRLQIEIAGARPAAVTLDGQPLTVGRGLEGDCYVSCHLTGRHLLRVSPATADA